jgi:hypothetical protein
MHHQSAWLLFGIHASARECLARYLLEGIVRRHLVVSVSIAGQADQAGEILPRFRAIEGGQIVATNCLHSSVRRKDAHRCRCRSTA